MDKKLELLFEDLEANGMDNYAYKYNVKEANQIIRKHFEALILPVVGITFKEKIEKEIVELREELAKLLNDKLSAYTSVDDWSDKIAFITGKIEGLKSALN